MYPHTLIAPRVAVAVRGDLFLGAPAPQHVAHHLDRSAGTPRPILAGSDKLGLGPLLLVGELVEEDGGDRAVFDHRLQFLRQALAVASIGRVFGRSAPVRGIMILSVRRHSDMITPLSCPW